MKRLARVSLALVVSALLGAGLALTKESQQPEDAMNKGAMSSQSLRGGFGRPETVTGIVLMVKPEQGIVALALRGPSQPPSTDIVVHARNVQVGDAVIREEKVTTFEAPGETDFNFKVANSTLIKVDGRRVALGDLARFTGREATIRFVPRRAGNFALGIEVG